MHDRQGQRLPLRGQLAAHGQEAGHPGLEHPLVDAERDGRLAALTAQGQQSVDDRGVGGSTGDAQNSTTNDLAGDALAAVAFLKSCPEIDSQRIGLVGHSEGGLIAPMVAVRSKDVAFIVLMAGTGLPGDEILRMQAGLILKAMGAADDVK